VSTPTLYVFAGHWSLETTSPFCQKTIETFRLAGVDVEIQAGNPASSPTGKVPLLETEDGRIADSSQIEGWLARTHGFVPAPGDATPDDLARTHGLRRTLEDSLYWTMVYSRWVDDDGWAIFSAPVRAMVPAFAAPLAVPMIKRSVVKQCRAVGLMGRPKEQVYARGVDDLDAIARLYGDRPFAFGDAPAAIDCAVYGFLRQLTEPPIESVLKMHALEHPFYPAFITRMADVTGRSAA
jgi:glutathione S-transferase